MSEPELLTVVEAARELRVSRDTVYRWIREGRIGSVKLASGTVRIGRSHIRSFARDRVASPKADHPWRRQIHQECSAAARWVHTPEPL